MKKIKSPTENKLILQILSVLAAIVLWFAIVHTEDPSVTVTLNNIPLKVMGENNMEKNQLILVDEDKIPNVSAEIRGRRSEVKSVLNSVTAKVDISDITEPGVFQKDISFDIPNPSVMLSKKRTSSVSLSIEKAIEKQIPVYINQIGADKNKEFLVKSTPKIKTVNIMGSSQDISRIKEAVLTFDASAITENTEIECKVSYAGENHSALTLFNDVSCDTENIIVKNEILRRKTVAVVINPELDLSEYHMVIKGFSKSSVEIGLSDEDYDKVDSIYADFTTGISPSQTNKYDMSLIIPDNVYFPEQDTKLTLNAEIEKIKTDVVAVTVTAENVPTGTTARLSAETISVSMTGPESKMKNVKAKVDLSGLDKGSFSLPVVFVTDNTGITINSEYKVNVTISE